MTKFKKHTLNETFQSLTEIVKNEIVVASFKNERNIFMCVCVLSIK